MGQGGAQQEAKDAHALSQKRSCAVSVSTAFALPKKPAPAGANAVARRDDRLCILHRYIGPVGGSFLRSIATRSQSGPARWRG
jgi:hypothetical protein